MQNERETTQALPEAPASASAKMVSPNGIEWLLTVRDFTVNGLLKKAAVMEEHLLKDGWSSERYAAPATNGNGHMNGNGAAADHYCEVHPTVKLLKSKHRPDELYCPEKLSDVGGGRDGSKPVYCKYKHKL